MTPWKKKTLPIWQEVSCVSRETNISPFFQACLKMGYHPRWDMSVVSWRVSPWDRPPHRPTREAKSVPLWGLGRWSRWRDLWSKVEDWNPGETPRKIEMDGKKMLFRIAIRWFFDVAALNFQGVYKVNLAVQKMDSWCETHVLKNGLAKLQHMVFRQKLGVVSDKLCTMRA